MLRVQVLPGLDTGERTEGMKKIVLFFKESFAELKKVTWPSRDEVVSSTKVVLLSTLIVAGILGALDIILVQLVTIIF
jgi:preprotein translocase subunit SecE